MSTDETIFKRRAEQARKAYGTQLYNFYQGWVVFESLAESDDVGLPTLEEMQETPEFFDGAVAGENPADELISAYLLMLQAERDARAGCAVDGEPIDRLIRAFDAWMEPIWGLRRPPW
jgi:hypothetical protein